MKLLTSLPVFGLALLCASQLFAQPAQAPPAKSKKGASVPPAVIPEKFTGKVVGVLDGDTIRVANAEISVVTIRLEAIDAPELAQDFGREAHKYLHDLIANQQVTVQWKERDKYQRLLGFVYLDKNFINRTLVEEGYAWQFTKYNSSDSLKKLELVAREKKRGLWSGDSPIAPWDWRDGKRPPATPQALAAVPAVPDLPTNSKTAAVSPPLKVEIKLPAKQAEPTPAPTVTKDDPVVYLTKTGTHYHSAGCRHLSKSSIPIKLSRASAYTPCQHCNPPK